MAESGATEPKKDPPCPVDPKTFMTPNFEVKFNEANRVWIQIPKAPISDICKIYMLNAIFLFPSIIWNLYLLLVVPSRYFFLLRHCFISLFPSIFAILSTIKFEPGYTRCQLLTSFINLCWMFYGFCLVPLSLTSISTTMADCDILINMCFSTENEFHTKVAIGVGAQVLYGFFLFGEGQRLCLLTKLQFFSIRKSVSSSLSFSRDETYSVEYEPEEKEQKKEKNPADIIIAA